MSIRTRRSSIYLSALSIAALTISLSGCGALVQLGNDSKPTQASSEVSSEETGGAPSESAQPLESPSSASASAESTEQAAGEQPAGDPSDPTSWLITAEYAPLTGIESYEVNRLLADRDKTFTMDLNITGASFTPECEEVLSTIDQFERPASEVVTASYNGNFKTPADATGEPQVETASVVTEEEEDIMSLYSKAARTCKNVDGPISVTFDTLNGHDVLHVTLSDGSKSLEAYFGGKSIGNKHIYSLAVNLEPSEAEAFIEAQLDLFTRSVEGGNPV